MTSVSGINWGNSQKVAEIAKPRSESQKSQMPVGASKMTLVGAADFTYLIAKEWGKSLIYRGVPPLFYSA